MADIAAILACVILAGLTAFQLALICGAPIGKYAWGGQHNALPTRLKAGSVVSIVLYGVIAALILSKTEIITVFAAIADVGIWITAAYFWLGVVLNGVSRSKHERAVMTPVALALAVLTTIVALS